MGRNPRAGPPAMIQLDQDRLASGLNAMATQDDGVVTIIVSTALAPVDRRAALRVTLRAARRAGWISRRVPLFLLPLARGMPFARIVARGGRAAVAIAGEPLAADYDTSHGAPQATAAAGVPRPPAPFRFRERRGRTGALRCWSSSRRSRRSPAWSPITWSRLARLPARPPPASLRSRRMGPPAGIQP